MKVSRKSSGHADGNRGCEFRSDALLIFSCELMKDREKDALILGVFTFGERASGAPGFFLIGRLAMSAHDATAGRDALVEENLHNLPLIHAVGQTNAVALIVTPSPVRLEWHLQISSGQKGIV